MLKMFQSSKLEKSNNLNIGSARDLKNEAGITVVRESTSLYKPQQTYNGENIPLMDAIADMDKVPIITYIDQKLLKQDNIMTFNILKINDEHKQYNCLHISNNNENRGEKAYYCPQGKSIAIPIKPSSDDPKYVFTATFCGCSFVVDHLNANQFRVYHITGNKEDEEYNKKSKEEHGKGMIASLQYVKYGFTPNRIGDTSTFRENVFGIACLYYSHITGSWNMKYQGAQFSSGGSPTINEINGSRVAAILPQNFNITRHDTLHLDPIEPFATANFSNQTMPGYKMEIVPANTNNRYPHGLTGSNQNAITNRSTQQQGQRTNTRNNGQLSIEPVGAQPSISTRPSLNNSQIVPVHLNSANRPAIANPLPRPGLGIGQRTLPPSHSNH